MEYVPAKTIVNRTKSTEWFGTDYNMNIYRGCCHGCIYCDSRSDCYHVGEFDRVRAKENALQIIRDDLRRKVRKGVVATGAMSDPYNPFEAELQLTRRALMLLDAFEFGVAVDTKSDLVARDADLLKEIAAHSPVLVKLSVTTADDRLCEKVEPRAPLSSARFAAMEALAKAGIFTGVLLMPVLPFLEDNAENVRGIVRRARESGARFVYPGIGMTMRDGQREWFYARLEEAFPGEGLAEKYARRYGSRYNCTSPRAKELYALLAQECTDAGLLYRMKDIVSGYRQGYESTQLSFF